MADEYSVVKPRGRVARDLIEPGSIHDVASADAMGVKKPGSDSGQREPGGILQPASSCFARQGFLAVLAGI